MTDAELAEIKKMIDAATSEPLQRNLYDHGGGRMYRDGGSGERKLVLDAYSEADRDFYFNARESMITLLAEVDRLKDENAKAWAEVLKLREKIEGDQLQPWER